MFCISKCYAISFIRMQKKHRITSMYQSPHNANILRPHIITKILKKKRIHEKNKKNKIKNYKKKKK